jgi:hypothetical protein
MTKCIQSTDQTLQTTNDISNNVNQYSDYESKNPFAFITDAIEAILKNLMIVAVVVFVSVIIMVVVFEIVKDKKPQIKIFFTLNASAVLKIEPIFSKLLMLSQIT